MCLNSSGDSVPPEPFVIKVQEAPPKAAEQSEVIASPVELHEESARQNEQEEEEVKRQEEE